MTDTKYCNGPDCQRHRPVTMFNKRRSTGDGLDYRCRYCRSITARKYYADHLERCREVSRAKVAAKRTPPSTMPDTAGSPCRPSSENPAYPAASTAPWTNTVSGQAVQMG